MVLVMLMLLFLALVSIGLWAYGHSLLTSAAAGAARYAANEDVPDAQVASERAAAIMSTTIAAGVADTVECSAPVAADPIMVEVHCEMAAPMVVPLLGDIFPRITVTAHALKEPS